MLKWKHPQKTKRATKSLNEQQKAFACFGFCDRINLKNKKEQRRAAKGNERQMETRTKNQKATKSIFHSHFHSFAPILDQWKVVDIKSNEKPERATTATKSNEKQQKAMKSNKKQQRKSELEKPKRARNNQDEQRKAQEVQMETRLKG